MDNATLARMIDHTNLKPEATRADAARLVREAIERRFAAVCVNGVFLREVRLLLDQAAERGAHGVLACAVAAFPLGAMSPMAASMECTTLAKKDSGGADEIDLVAHLPTLAHKDSSVLRDTLLHTVRAVRAAAPRIVVKVILETAALRAMARTDADFEAMIAAACAGVREAGCDFVKTSTGFHPAGGATVEAVRLLKKHAGPLKVKASGGIRTREDALRLIEAGADRIGTSSGVAMVSGA
ncbi:MAG: deoxyribose-phosphate aldolase [Phycisphaerales bacterium]|nr:deoxyribose-phosphate aldolase [Phycisphaerales bacterium]